MLNGRDAYLLDVRFTVRPRTSATQKGVVRNENKARVRARIPTRTARCCRRSVGEAAPNFTATDSYGHPHSLAETKESIVVLEWHNQGCPYTKKHYESGNMQKLQKLWTSKGVVWFTVISSAPGEQGYVTAAQENDYVKRMGAAPTAVLLDPKRRSRASLRSEDDAPYVRHQPARAS